jgi:hypothetical protein
VSDCDFADCSRAGAQMNTLHKPEDASALTRASMPGAHTPSSFETRTFGRFMICICLVPGQAFVGQGNLFGQGNSEANLGSQQRVEADSKLDQYHSNLGVYYEYALRINWIERTCARRLRNV